MERRRLVLIGDELKGCPMTRMATGIATGKSEFDLAVWLVTRTILDVEVQALRGGGVMESGDFIGGGVGYRQRWELNREQNIEICMKVARE